MAVDQSQFIVKFWGTRGSIPCPGSETVRYGGNTPCIEMIVNGQRLIFDGGTGLRVLGQTLLAQMPLEAHVFFTHSHWDHIQGFPFFVPAFVKGNCFNIYGAIAPTGQNIKQLLEGQMYHPNFPVPLGIMGSDLTFNDIEVGKSLEIGNDVTVDTGVLNHPGGAVGYRVNWQGYAVAYITDTEHLEDGILDESVLKLSANADVMIYDSTYTNEEYYSEKSSKVGWGHSTWEEGVRVARAAGVKTLVVFHHDPQHNDDFLDKIGLQVAQAFPDSLMAKEGMIINVAPPCPPSKPEKPSSNVKISA